MSKFIVVVKGGPNSQESHDTRIRPPAGRPQGLGRFGVWLRYVDHRGTTEDAIFQLSQVDGPATANDRRIIATGPLRAGDVFEVHMKVDDDVDA